MTNRRLLQLEADLKEMVEHLDALERGHYRLVRGPPEQPEPSHDIIITQQVIERERRVVDAFKELIEKIRTPPVEDDAVAPMQDGPPARAIGAEPSSEHGMAHADESISRQDAPKSYSCHKCGMPMRVVSVKPDGPAQEMRMFACIGCKETKTVVVRSC